MNVDYIEVQHFANNTCSVYISLFLLGDFTIKLGYNFIVKDLQETVFVEDEVQHTIKGNNVSSILFLKYLTSVVTWLLMLIN